MRAIFQLCLLILVLLGTRTSCWGRMACPEPATAGQVFIRVDRADPDAPPLGVSSGGWLSHDATGFVDGPNLYAYVQQNPWTKFDPKGLNAVVVSGGPNTDRSKDPYHDKQWGNFVRAAEKRIEQMRKPTMLDKGLDKDERIEWIVERSSLEARAKNDKKNANDYIKEVEQKAKSLDVDLRWVESIKDFANAINTNSEGKERAGAQLISHFDFFGHGAPGKLGLTADFSQSLTNSNLESGMIHSAAFRPNAKYRSWGCNSASNSSNYPFYESRDKSPVPSSSFIETWAVQTGIPMDGLVGRMSYVPCGESRNPFHNIGLPVPGKQYNDQPSHPERLNWDSYYKSSNE